AALDYYQQSLAFFDLPPNPFPGRESQDGKPLAKISLTPPQPYPCQGEESIFQTKGSNYDFCKKTGIVLLQLGLAYYSKGEQHWLDSKNYLQQCLDKFEEARRQDLVAKHINQLGKVLQGLEDWESLENLAQKALVLHQSHGNPVRLTEDYGFLAEVALKQERWQDAKQWAKKALAILDNNPNIEEELFPSSSCLLPSAFSGGLYRLILAKSEQGLGEIANALGEIANAISKLEQARDKTQFQHQLSLYLEILKELRSLYFNQGQYREAFYLKLEQREVESWYGLRAFVGPGRLQPPVLRWREESQVTVAEQAEIVEDIVAASGRQKDVERLIERVNRADCKLTVIHGQSGVGKSSILQAGLLPALEVSYFEGRETVPVFVDVYTDWLGELGKGLSIDSEFRRRFDLGVKHLGDNLSMQPNVYNPNADASYVANATLTPFDILKLQKILEQLRQNEQHHRLTVLIFDQFEEFFFVYKDQASRRPFYEFLRHCLEIPYVKIILSLREDYLHYLLELTRTTNLEGFDDNYKHILYYLGNFSPADAKAVIWNLTQRSQFYLEPDLVEELVREFAGEVGEMRPIELQIVGAQLQTEQITTLKQYQTKGTKDELVKQFLADVVKDCGVGNEQIANLVLYLLTDENNTRPFKTREDLEFELEVQAEILDLLLEILVKSRIVLRVPGFPAERYQLVHDYLVTVIRTQNPESARLIAELEREREQRKFTEKKLNEVLKKQLREARRGLVWSAIAGGLAMVLPWVFMGRNNIYLSSMSAESKRLLGSNKDLQALVESIKAGKRLKRLGIGIKPETEKQVETALQDVVHTIRERNSFEGHKDSVTSVSFSPDGKLIASGSEDNTVKLWSLDGQEIATFEGHEDKITSIAFSPNGKLIASGSEDNTVKLWNLDGKEMVTFEGHEEIVTSVAFSPNGTLIASGSEDETVKIWNLDGKEVDTFEGHKDKITGVVFSPDGQMIASSSLDETVRLWNLEGKELKTLNHYDPVTSVSFSPAGKTFPKEFGLTIISLVDGNIKIWRSDGSLLKTLYRYFYGEGGNFNIEGKTIVMSSYYSSQIYLRFLQTDNKYRVTSITLNGHRNGVTSVSLSPDGKMLASASKDKTVKLWQLENSGFESPIDIDSSYKQVTSVSLSPDDKMVTSTSANNSIYYSKTKTKPKFLRNKLELWSLDGKLIKTLKGVNANASFSSDSQMLASASVDKTAQLWSRDGTGLDSHNNIASVSYSKDGQTIALVKTDNKVQLFDRDGTLLTTLKGHRDKIYRVDLSPNGQTIATTSDDHTVKLWQRDGTLLTTIKGHRDKIYRVDLSPNGQTIATASDDHTVKLWGRDGTLIKTLAGYNDEIQGLGFSPNGETLALHSGDNTVKFFRRDGALLKTVKGYGYQKMTVKFSPDDKTLAILDWGKDENTLEIRYIDGTLLKTVQVNGSLKGFSNDGKTIVTTDSSELQFWKLDGTLLSTFEKDVWKYSPDYRVIVTYEDRKTFKLWRRDGSKLSTISIKGKSLYDRYEQFSKEFHFSPNNKTLAVQTSKNTVELWSIDGTFITTIQVESERFLIENKAFYRLQEELISLPMSFSPNSQILAIRTDDNKVELWSVDGKLIDTIQGQVDAVTDLSFVPESETLVISGYDDAVKLWQPDSTEQKVLPDHNNQVNRVSFSPDGKTIASASDDKTFKLWNRDGTLIKTIDKHSDKVNDVSFSPDGKTIASASDDKTIKLWKRDGTTIKSLEEHGNGVNHVSFSPDSKLIASASDDKTVKLWSIEEEESRKTLDHDYPVTSVSFHPDGKLIASASWKTVKLWSIDGEEIATFERLGGGDVSFSRDGNIVGISYGRVALWNSDLDELLERGCNWVRDYLKNNLSVEKKDRKLCDDIGTQE
ncbi:MAG: hypothetical protein F6J92_23290, partial [Symploca sp. SIO1A3]|nr:hypothetical protein [Symploca sp. SIO1A3]